MNKNKKTDLIFVWVGKDLPNWAIISVNLALKNSNCKVYLLTSKISKVIHSTCTQVEISSFYSGVNLNYLNSNLNFRDGFWIKTTERFFILNEFIKANKIESFFHAELDNLIFNLSDLASKFDKIGSGMFLPKDSSDRCIASLIYINRNNIIDDFCKYILLNPKFLSNDMLLLGDFSINHSSVYYLPNETVFNEFTDSQYVDFKRLSGIFDAAAIGQYLFGIDPRNSMFPIFNMFLNENVKYHLPNCSFYVSIEDNLATINDINLYNIHVHSKIFNKINNELWLNNLINRINKSKKTFITYKYFN